MLHLDGSRFSGSGTIVRFELSLAALAGQELRLLNDDTAPQAGAALALFAEGPDTLLGADQASLWKARKRVSPRW